jgi:uncharacterized protein involved in exopolysaccharide biosynthesis
MNKDENLFKLIKIILKNWKFIAVITILGIIGSVGISLTLPNYFRATTSFYAASSDLSNPDVIFGQSNFPIQYYGNANDIDRLLTLAESGELVGHLIDSFDLHSHYNISPDETNALHKVQTKFSNLFEVKKTKLNAVQISIEDLDPEFAATVANEARNKIDHLGQELIRKSNNQLISTYEANIEKKKKALGVIVDSLKYIKNKYGIYNSKAQSEAISEAMTTTKGKLANNRAKYEALKKVPNIPYDTLQYMLASVRGLEKQLDAISGSKSGKSDGISDFNEGKTKVEYLENEYGSKSWEIINSLERLEKIKIASASEFPTIHLIEEATVPIYKHRPKRSILVIGAAMLAFILSIFAVLVAETWKNFSRAENE